MTRTCKYLPIFLFIFFPNIVLAEKIYEIGEIEFGQGDKSIEIDPKLQEFTIAFTTKIRPGCNFIIIDLPIGYEINSAFPFKNRGREGKWMRFKYALLSTEKRASIYLPIHIVKIYSSATNQIRAGIYPLAEGLCQ